MFFELCCWVSGTVVVEGKTVVEAGVITAGIIPATLFGINDLELFEKSIFSDWEKLAFSRLIFGGLWLSTIHLSWEIVVNSSVWTFSGMGGAWLERKTMKIVFKTKNELFFILHKNVACLSVSNDFKTAKPDG